MPDDSGSAPEPEERPEARPRRRRVTTAPPAGSDPAPQQEPERHAEGENDARLRQDKPPHY
ncbi:hypothetical protein [Pseudolysinimonas sp.]|uniref:hypothetical protein n=1 Tax=Pseudolysinimonas sp. TaxID=2680009 RepID=UPI003F7D4EAA